MPRITWLSRLNLWSKLGPILVISILGCTLVCCGPSGPPRPEDRYQLLPASDRSSEPVAGTLRASFIAIPDGESCLIELPDETIMLVDTGASFGRGYEITAILRHTAHISGI